MDASSVPRARSATENDGALAAAVPGRAEYQGKPFEDFHCVPKSGKGLELVGELFKQIVPPQALECQCHSIFDRRSMARLGESAARVYIS